jgi:hypothetical protein
MVENEYKKSGEIATLIKHTLNKEGKIIRERYYFNPSQFHN